MFTLWISSPLKLWTDFKYSTKSSSVTPRFILWKAYSKFAADILPPWLYLFQSLSLRSTELLYFLSSAMFMSPVILIEIIWFLPWTAKLADCKNSWAFLSKSSSESDCYRTPIAQKSIIIGIPALAKTYHFI